MKPTTMPNQLTVACASKPMGPTELTFAINGVVVAKTVVPMALTYWAPEAYIVGTHGPATATFTQIVQSTW